MRSSALVRHLSRNLVGYIALFLALSTGVAWALEANSIRSVHIKNGAVTAKDLAGANTLYGTAQNINGSNTVLFSVPAMGFRLRADGDLDTGDLGVKVESTRGSGGTLIYVLETVGDPGKVVTPADGMQPSYQPSEPRFTVVDSESSTPRAISVTCGSQSAQGIIERVWCWGSMSKP